MIRRSLFWSLSISFVFVCTAATAWADKPKSPEKEPAKRSQPADKLVGDTPTSRTAPPASRPTGSKSSDERKSLLHFYRLAALGAMGLTPREIFLIRLEKYLRKNPNDSQMAFYHAYLSQVDGDNAPIKQYCNTKEPNRSTYYKLYCEAWSKGQVSTYRSMPTPAILGGWIKQLYTEYKKNRKDRVLRYDILMLASNSRFRRDPKAIAIRDELLADDKKSNPNSLTENLFGLMLEIGKSYRNRSKLAFVLPKAQAFAKKHPNSVEAQFILMRVARRLHARPVMKQALKDLYKVAQGKSLHHQFIRVMLDYQAKKYDDALKTITALAAKKPSAEIEYHYVNLLCTMLSRVAWRKKKEAEALYTKLLKQYPKHARVFIDAGYNKYQLKKKDEATKLYEASIPLIDNLRLLRSLYWKLSYRNRKLAVKLLSHYIKLHPEHAWSLSKRAYQYRRMNKDDLAAKDYKALLNSKGPIPASIYADISQHYRSQEAYPKALKILNRGIKAHPNSSSLYGSRAYIYKRMNEHKKAAADYLKAYKIGRGYSWHARSYIQQLQEMKQHDKAIAFLKKEMVKATGNNKKQFISMYSKALYKAGRTQEAKAFVLKQGDADALLQAARTTRRKGKLDRALELCKAALLKGSRKYTKRSIYQEMANIYKKQSKNKKAAEMYQKVIELNPDRYYSYYSLANFYKYTLKDHKKAVRVWDAFIARKPKNPQAYYYRAEAHKSAKDKMAALMDYMRGLHYSKKERYDYSRIASFLRYDVKRYDLAIELWNDFLLNNPKDASAYRNRAKLYEKQKNYEAAMRDYRKAIALKPNDLYSYSTLADLYQYRLKKPNLALDVWSRLIDKQPKNARAYRKRAYLYRRLKQYERSAADYNTAIKLKPTDRYSYRPLASLYSFYLKDQTKAIDVWSKYIQLRKYDSYGYIERAKLYEKAKDWKKALGDWKVAIKKTTSNWRRRTVTQGLARSYHALGKYKEAVNLLKPQLAKTTSSYRKRSLAKALVQSMEKLGQYKEAIAIIKPFLNSRYDRVPKFIYVRLLAGSGEFDKALAQALSYCSGAEKMRYSYYRRKACRQHKWLQYGLGLMKNPFNAKSYTKPLESPAQKRTRSNTNFRNILKLLLQRGKKKKAPEVAKPVPARPRK
ncbi:MAG: tetratricopeptide repeat protein [Deltaproteobacteria bacterium]|nr:MAG: tetratricopeptide repeat protein [Deltaproteobacteria bacterium]